MLKIDLITGFLGAGKTTFLKKYAKYFMEKGQNIGILENDFGAVNVDMMLLQDLMGEQCEIEMIAGGCDKETHRRRFRTKLIAMRMCGYDRILVEPSGVFDVDEFFDILRDDPLDQWYEIGNVIAIVPANLEHELSESADYILASEVANAGKILFSHADETEKNRIEETLTHLNHALEQIHCGRKIEMGDVWCGNLEEPGAMDLDVISQCGYELESYEKMDLEKHQGFESVYLMDMHFSEKDLKEFVDKIMKNTECGDVNVAGDHDAADIESAVGEYSDQAQHVEVVCNAQIVAHFVLCDISGVDRDDDLRLVSELHQHAEFAVRFKTRKHAGCMVIIIQLAAKLQI